MKKNVFTLLAGAALLCACQPAQKGTTISGTLTGTGSDTLIAIISPVTREGQTIRDTIALQNGKFTVEVTNDTIPSYVNILPKPVGNQAVNMTEFIQVLAIPGQPLTVTGSFKDYQVTGNDFYAKYNEAQKGWKDLEDKLNQMSQTAIEMEQQGISGDSIRQFYAPAREMIAQMVDKTVEYIRQHPDEDVSLYLATRVGEHFEEVFPLLTEKVKNGPLAALYQTLDKSLQQMKAREEAAKKIVEGAEAPDFTLNDLQGKPLSLSSLRGKYVVLDFWGSWCGWCIKGIPDMKKYYEKYKGKLEILGIDCRDTEEKWKAAVEKHELPWLHVYNAGNPDVSILYAIQGYPTKIVVDPEGKIAKIVVGEDPAFYQYLDELFK